MNEPERRPLELYCERIEYQPCRGQRQEPATAARYEKQRALQEMGAIVVEQGDHVLQARLASAPDWPGFELKAIELVRLE